MHIFTFKLLVMTEELAAPCGGKKAVKELIDMCTVTVVLMYQSRDEASKARTSI